MQIMEMMQIGQRPTSGRPSAEQVAEALTALYDTPFSGRERGRFRISRKLLRQLAGRQRLPSGLLDQVTEELFEKGLIFVDMESYFVLLEQRLFRSYRRVPASVMDSIASSETA